MADARQGREILKELQKMIADELGEKNPANTFRPMTDGLGLASPRRPETASPLPPLTQALTQEGRAPLFGREPTVAHAPPPRRPIARPPAKIVMPDSQQKNTMERMFSPPPPRMEVRPVAESLAPDLLGPAVQSEVTAEVKPEAKMEVKPAITLRMESTTSVPPPAIAAAGLAQRFFAFVVDQVFVWTVFLFTVIVTLKVVTGQDAYSLPNSGNLQNPLFLRFILVEFASLWLAYLVVGVGILDMTFGMWVWGLRLRYRGNEDDVKFIKKSIRVVATFIFFAPILPSIVLMFRRRGRNLLDLISGTGLCRSVV